MQDIFFSTLDWTSLISVVVILVAIQEDSVNAGFKFERCDNTSTSSDFIAISACPLPDAVDRCTFQRGYKYESALYLTSGIDYGNRLMYSVHLAYHEDLGDACQAGVTCPGKKGTKLHLKPLMAFGIPGPNVQSTMKLRVYDNSSRAGQRDMICLSFPAEIV